MRPFVDYYRSQGISPVAQDISDLQRHFQRRESLFRILGVPPGLVAGRSVIEFGPGSGHNALYTHSLEPQRMVLVDGNPVGVAEMRRLFEEHFPASRQPAIVESLWEDFDSEELFDIVVCEGAIPGQLDPPATARRLARFVRPGGIFMLTCIDPASLLAESCRRLIGDRLSAGMTVRDRLDALRPFFAPHLATLAGASRQVDDWLLDMFTHPWTGRLFSVADAIDALDGDFDIYGASPQFFSDWRWYKQVVGSERRFNERARDAFLRNVVNFTDYRVLTEPHAPAIGEAVLSLCASVYDAMLAAEQGRGDFSGIPHTLGEIARTMRPLSPRTAASVQAFAACLAGDPAPLGPETISFFGRGQQNVTFIRRAAPLVA